MLIRRSVNAFAFQFSATTRIIKISAQGDDWWDGYNEKEYNRPTFNYGDDVSSRGRSSRSFRTRDGGDRSSFGSRNRDYTRDTSRDSSNVDERAVMDLLQKRVEAKKNRDFDTADAIREDLLMNFSVAVDDKERIWRTGASASGSGRTFGSRLSGKDRGPRKDRKPRDFGPNGHDYFITEDAGSNVSSLTDSQIHSLLADRLQAKMSRSFDVADKIQMQLIEAGVYVHDALKEWRADGIPYGDLDGGGRPGKMFGSRSFQDQPYTRSEFSSDPNVTDELIDGLVAERMKFKLNREYDKADAVREGLRTKFNVMIDDRLRQWSVGGDFGEEHNTQRELAEKFANRGYIESQSSVNNYPDDVVAIIEKRIDDRNAAKKNRDFETADSIREELLAKYDVTINDKLKLWSAGGYFEELGGKMRTPRGVYTRRGGGDLSEEDVKYVEDMLTQRYNAKKNRDFETADSIRDVLQANFNISIDDKESVWRVDSSEYFQTGDAKLSKNDQDYIIMRLQERFECKRNRDYEGADAIRESLANQFGVKIDDRNKEWRVESAEVVSVSNDYTDTVSDDVNAKLEMALEDVLNSDESEFLEESSNSQFTQEELNKLTVPSLKEKLKGMGLPVSGTKAVLIQRIIEN